MRREQEHREPDIVGKQNIPGWIGCSKTQS